MTLYLDASALVKLYLVGEQGAELVADQVEKAEMVGTSLVSRAETSAAIAKAVRRDVLSEPDGRRAIESFRRSWSGLVRLPVGEDLVEEADRLAWTFSLRGYDSVHLAAAVTWQRNIGSRIKFACYDRELRESARQQSLEVFPSHF